LEAKKIIIMNEQIRQDVISFIQSMNIESYVQVDVKDYKKNRTIDQNALYHMWVEIFCELTGYTHDEQHEVFKAMFLPVIEKTVRGIALRELSSTTKLNTKEFSAYMREIEALAVEYGLVLPYPEELMYTME
jgi:hypothetical protein